MPSQGQSAITTYRALRIGVVAGALLLTTSLVVESVRAGGLVLTSISASYYSPVRNVFVGVLVATGMALITIMGRERGEDTALNVAGMLAPTIGLLPTTVGPSSPGACRDGVARCIPPSVLADVENNVTSLLVLGVIGLVGAAVYVIHTHGARSVQLRRMIVPVAIWLGSTILWLAARTLMLEHGHNLAAFSFFLLLAWVARVNAMDPPEGSTVLGMTPQAYHRGYQIISVAMFGTIAVTLVYDVGILVGWLPNPFPQWFFLAESLLLALFTAFWALQTAHFWRDGVPEDACSMLDEPGHATD